MDSEWKNNIFFIFEFILYFNAGTYVCISFLIKQYN